MNKNIQETKNKHIIYKLVKNHFSLSPESLKRFKHHFFFHPLHSKTFKEIDKQPDRRLRIPLISIIDSLQGDLELLFPNFKEVKSFYDNYRPTDFPELTYENYKTNKILIEKNQFKLFKLLYKIYLLSYARCFESSFTFKDDNKKIEKYLLEHETPEITHTFNLINTKLEGFIKNKESKNDVEIVISRNFADFFMCSTDQPFCSCLNLESDYSGAYWHGLPGLIVDNNRALIYIAEKGKYAEYNGVKVDKMISRSWIIDAKDQTHKSYTLLNVTRAYPNDSYLQILLSITKTIFKDAIVKEGYINSFVHKEKEFKNILSRKKFEPLRLNNGHSVYIYQDTTCFKIDNPHVFLDFSGSKNHETLDSNNRRTSSVINFDRGLNDLISNNETILDHSQDEEDYEDDEGEYYSCDDCDDCDETVSYYSDVDRYLCDDCFNEDYFTCESCGSVHHVDDAYEGANGNWYCENCFNEKFTYCSHCESVEHNRDIIDVDGEYLCDDCYNDLTAQCDKCGEVHLTKDMISENDKWYCSNTCLEQSKISEE